MCVVGLSQVELNITQRWLSTPASSITRMAAPSRPSRTYEPLGLRVSGVAQLALPSPERPEALPLRRKGKVCVTHIDPSQLLIRLPLLGEVANLEGLNSIAQIPDNLSLAMADFSDSVTLSKPSIVGAEFHGDSHPAFRHGCEQRSKSST